MGPIVEKIYNQTLSIYFMVKLTPVKVKAGFYTNFCLSKYVVGMKVWSTESSSTCKI